VAGAVIVEWTENPPTEAFRVMSFPFSRIEVGSAMLRRTTVLLTVEETLAALEKAASIRYRPPGEEG